MVRCIGLPILSVLPSPGTNDPPAGFLPPAAHVNSRSRANFVLPAAAQQGSKDQEFADIRFKVLFMILGFKDPRVDFGCYYR
jgi:hypothetical protein